MPRKPIPGLKPVSMKLMPSDLAALDRIARALPGLSSRTRAARWAFAELDYRIKMGFRVRDLAASVPEGTMPDLAPLLGPMVPPPPE